MYVLQTNRGLGEKNHQSNGHVDINQPKPLRVLLAVEYLCRTEIGNPTRKRGRRGGGGESEGETEAEEEEA